MQALARFQNDPSCCVLVMDGSAAVGLDLSFVSRVYLMEPIWDKSLEEQVTLAAVSFELCCTQKENKQTNEQISRQGGLSISDEHFDAFFC